MVGIIQDKSAGVIWNVSRILQHALCAETFQIFPRFLKMQIGAIHGRFCQNVSSLLQTALAPNAPGVYNAMECESAHGALPTLHTYTLILQAWVRFGPESENPVTLSGSIIQGP